MGKNKSYKTPQINLGRCLIIVNPVAQSGRGSANGNSTFQILRNKYNADVDLFFTQHDGHAMSIAEDADKYDSIVAVGGDGVVHEIATGIMRMKKKDRPILGVIPVGSGNDYARSLGMSFKVEKAIDELMHSKVCEVDVGKCNDKFFVETLSFGLDAGIAIATMKAREKSKEKGFKLYFKCGIDRIINHFYRFNIKAKLDDGETINDKTYILAIQLGKTYGGGFKITPEAEIDDGYFDICYTSGKMSRKRAITVFAKASKGMHKNNKIMRFAKSKNINLKIDEEVPCQMDGEEYSNTQFKISTLHHALKVYRNVN